MEGRRGKTIGRLRKRMGRLGEGWNTEVWQKNWDKRTKSNKIERKKE